MVSLLALYYGDSSSNFDEVTVFIVYINCLKRVRIKQKRQ